MTNIITSACLHVDIRNFPAQVGYVGLVSAHVHFQIDDASQKGLFPVIPKIMIDYVL